MIEILQEIERLKTRIRALERIEQPNYTWQSWTPTVTQGVAITVTVDYAYYVVIGSLAALQTKITCTSAGTAANAVVIGNIPTAIQAANSDSIIGNMLSYAVATDYHGAIYVVGANDWRFVVSGNLNAYGVTPAVTIANGHVFWLQATYERA